MPGEVFDCHKRTYSTLLGEVSLCPERIRELWSSTTNAICIAEVSRTYRRGYERRDIAFTLLMEKLGMPKDLFASFVRDLIDV